MPNSNYPTGFPQGVTIKGVPLTVTNPGRVWWLSNATTLVKGDRNGSDGNKGTYNSPFSTLQGAVTAIAADSGANRGDILIVKPGHAENIASSTACTVSVAGLAIIGLGTGSNRPTFTFTTAATATINISAANVSFTNCIFTANFLSVAAALTVASAKNFTVQACLFQDTAAATDFLQCIQSTGTANTADGLTVLDSVWNGTGVTSVTSMVLIADANINVTMLRNRCTTLRTGDFPILVTVTTGASKNIELGDNIVISKQTASTLGVLAGLGATSTGSVYRNYAGTLVTTADILFTTTVGVYPFENRVSGVVGATGFVIPAVDS